MPEKITLSKPILINGNTVSELTYDIDSITPDYFLEADARASTGLAAKGIQNMNLAEFNSALHYYLGCFAIIACNPQIDIMDLKQLSGRDINKVRRTGQRFFNDTAQEDDQDETASTQKPSESSSEATAGFMESAPRLLDD